MAVRVFSLLLVLAVGSLARPQSRGPPPGSAPAGIASSFRPQTPPKPLGPFRPSPGTAPGGIASAFRPQTPEAAAVPPPGSAPGGFVSSLRPQRPFIPAGPTGSGLRPGTVPEFRPSGPFIPILVDERDGPHADGSYRFNFETGNGISRQEEGYPRGPEGAVVSQGSWSFTFPDGTPAVFSFVADENGYRVESPLLPTPPPPPAHAIAQIEFARQQRAQQG